MDSGLERYLLEFMGGHSIVGSKPDPPHQFVPAAGKALGIIHAPKQQF